MKSLTKTSEVLLKEKLVPLNEALETEDSIEFNNKLLEFKEWLNSLDDNLKSEILPFAMDELKILIERVQSKLSLYEELRLDQNIKKEVNSSYGLFNSEGE